MLLRFLGVDTRNSGSPTLYASERDTYIVLGWEVPEQDSRNIEIPHRLLTYLEEGTCLGTLLHDTGHGTFLLEGEPVTDPAALEAINSSAGERSIEVPMGKEVRPDDATTQR
ncbi:hypothetical protein [Nocardia crassostreae]|uniref:hypothetical protein n=1 Tax=Nocardia crassostreae TaxID=53428 RepID=UPI00082C9F26|nr:hypothetical protein [Nocardia crassostreae]